MIITDILYRGEDKTIIFVLKDKENQPVDFDSLVDCQIEVKVNKVLQVKFSKVETEGFGDVLPIESETNQCKILLTSVMTKEFPKGLLEVDFSMFIADDDYPEGRKETDEIPLYIVE